MTAVALRRIWGGPLDRATLMAVAGLLLIGLAMVYSASFALAYETYGVTTYFLTRQATWMAIGLAVMLLLARVDYRHWRRLSVPIMALTLALLVAVLVVGEETLGARRWFLGRSLQPSEFAKLATVLYVAHWISSKGQRIRDVTYGLAPFAVLIGLVTGLIVLQPDFGTAILIVCTAVAVFFIAGADLFQLGIGFVMGSATLYFLILQSSYAAQRISTYLSDPLTDPFSASSYQVTQTLIALGSGGLTGLGLGASQQKMGFIPVPHSDAIFAIIGEELGLLGSAAVLALFALLGYRVLRIALRAPDAYGMLLAAGVGCWLIFQALMNVGVVTATLPFTGLPLPLVSFGGSSLVVSLAGIGILLNIAGQEGGGSVSLDNAALDHGWRNRRPRVPSGGRRGSP